MASRRYRHPEAAHARCLSALLRSDHIDPEPLPAGIERGKIVVHYHLSSELAIGYVRGNFPGRARGTDANPPVSLAKYMYRPRAALEAITW